MAGTLELDPLLSQILKHLQTVVAYDSAAVLRVGSDGQILVQANQGPLSQEEALLLRLAADSPHLNHVIETQEPRIIADVGDDAPFARSCRAAMGESEPTRSAPYHGPSRKAQARVPRPVNQDKCHRARSVICPLCDRKV